MVRGPGQNWDCSRSSLTLDGTVAATKCSMSIEEMWTISGLSEGLVNYGGECIVARAGQLLTKAEPLLNSIDKQS